MRQVATALEGAVTGGQKVLPETWHTGGLLTDGDTHLGLRLE